MYMNNGMYNAGIGMDVYGQSMQTQNPYGGMMGMQNMQIQPQQQLLLLQQFLVLKQKKMVLLLLIENLSLFQELIMMNLVLYLEEK